MKTTTRNVFKMRGTLALLAGIGLLVPAAQVMARDDQPTPMAPPVTSPSATVNAANVFNWREVPQNQQVPLLRATFDQGGYQLYDQVGETIIVPFENNNLYVMKFAVSKNGQTYFVNDKGNDPVLYLPKDGYLENATAPGAFWYPFDKKFAPSKPVYMGVAPSYSEFVAMGWYPGELFYGGFFSDVAFVDGGFFGPTLGLSFIIGGHPYFGWDGYRQYVIDYPAPYRTGILNRDFYRLGGRPNFPYPGTVAGATAYPGASNRGIAGDGAGSGFRGARSSASPEERPSFGGFGGRGFGGGFRGFGGRGFGGGHGGGRR